MAGGAVLADEVVPPAGGGGEPPGGAEGVAGLGGGVRHQGRRRGAVDGLADGGLPEGDVGEGLGGGAGVTVGGRWAGDGS